MSARLVRSKNDLEKIKQADRLKGADLEALADLMLSHKLSSEEAEKVIDGKPVDLRMPQKRIIKKRGYRILENGASLEVWQGKDRVGDMQYSHQEFMGGESMWIHEMFIQPDHRRTGKGSAMIEHAVQVAERDEMDGLMLEVDRSNKDGIRFFEKNGFMEISALNDNHRDRLIMRKEVESKA